MPTFERLLPDLLSLAQRAGSAVLRHYNRPRGTIALKADSTPVTAADLEANALLVDGLSRLAPDVPCVSEEGPVPEFALRRDWGRFWLLDPLDGTKEFVRGSGDFTVNISLVVDRVPVIGVVHAPALDASYFAAEGAGAWRIDRGGAAVRLRSSPHTGRGGWRVAESLSHTSPELERFLAGIEVRERVRIGSSLKFCKVAEGAADMYPRFGPTMEWDTAAGDAVYRWSGESAPRQSPLTYNKPSLRNGPFIIGAEALGPRAGAP